MTISEITLFLQENYSYGVIVCSAVVIMLYLILSFRILYGCRKEGMKVWALAFVPSFNLVVWVTKCVIAHLNKREVLNEEFEI